MRPMLLGDSKRTISNAGRGFRYNPPTLTEHCLQPFRLTALILSVCALTASSSSFGQIAPVSFARDVKSILAHSCYECHGKGKTKGGLSMMSRAELLKGGKNGAVIAPGKSAESAMIKRLLSKDPDEMMPPEGDRLSEEQVAVLKRWIDQGLVWDELTPEQLAARRPQNVTPRRVAAPAGEGNPIDRILAGYFKANKVAPSHLVDNRAFARRLYLDLVGLPPTPEELETFLKDTQPDKRAQLVARLLADEQRYADHWMTFWQDHLRDGLLDLGSTDIVRPISPWLLHALKTNRPYDQMVRELVNPTIPKDYASLDSNLPTQDDAKGLEKEVKPDEADSFGFIQGLRGGLEKPRGDQRWEVQAVQNISQVFLGSNLKCATCHDSFIDYWTMKDTWGLASVYADKPLEVIRCEMPQGVHPQPSFLFSEVGRIDPSATPAVRRKQLAELVTSPKNGRFSRTIVNRIWCRLMGRGIIDPVDDMDNAPFDADLMDYLATEFVDGGYDLRKLIGLIVSSNAYQMPANDPGKSGSSGKDLAVAFNGPLLRRMTGEQFTDSSYALQGKAERIWKQNGGRILEILGRPDRRTVTTSRNSKSSPMQALELLNGPAIYEMIYLEGSAHVPRPTDDAAARKKEALKPKPNPRLAELAKMPPKELIARLYTQALSRPPTDKEMALQLELIGEKPTAESVGDMLWIVINLPEYQLIR